MPRPQVLQLSPLMASIQQRVDARFEAHPWPRPDAAADDGHGAAWLATHAPAIRAVLTAGNLGIETVLADRLPALGLVAINGVGYDRVDLDAMRARGVRVTNTPDVLTDDVADLAIALMINVMRHLPAADRHVRDKRWPDGPMPLGRRASGLRYGIVGLGRIGQAIARRLEGFGGSIAYTGPSPKAVAHDFHCDARALAAWSDVLFVATSASAATIGLIDRDVLDALGPEGVLINIARGAIVDEPALVAALVERRLGAAGLDVFADEPHVPDALLSLPQVSLAPHVGSATRQTREAMGQLMIDNLDAFFAGQALPTPVA